MNLVSLLFSFDGRIGRAQFWIVAAIWAGVAFGIVLLLAGASELLGLTLPLAVYYVIAAIVYIPMIVSGVAAGIKRLHDRNKSGWWLLVFYLLPAALPWAGLLVMGGLGSDLQELPMPVVALYYVRIGIFIWALVELGCLRGTIGGNPHGADPVAPKPAQH
jgi:uncharacterized membrane protein YhaH (DUF805 family)